MRNKILVALLFMLSVLLLGCGAESGTDKATDSKGEVVLSADEEINKILDSMSDAEKVGQLVMIGIQGTAVDDDSLFMLHQYHIGGITLFDRNLESEENTKKLIAELQKGADEKLPLFIAVDEEGGPVARMKSFLPPPPAQSEIKTPEEARKSAEDIGNKLKNMGFNLNFAPVADVGTESPRYFSSNPNKAAELVGAASAGYHAAGILYTLKHFPGIGRQEVDSHKELSEITATKDELMAEAKPFVDFIKSGKTDGFIMVSHFKYPALDEQNPASLSKYIMTDLLRKELGYQGIIITDDMEMGAIANSNDFREVGVAAIKAGADIVLVCHEYEHETDVYLGILDAVESGEISKERLNDSVRRIIKAKRNL